MTVYPNQYFEKILSQNTATPIKHAGKSRSDKINEIKLLNIYHSFSIQPRYIFNQPYLYVINGLIIRKRTSTRTTNEINIIMCACSGKYDKKNRQHASIAAGNKRSVINNSIRLLNTDFTPYYL